MPRRSVRTNTYPLRKVVGTVVGEHNVPMELLECGHTQIRKEDIYGPTNAYRRRCWQCQRDAARLASEQPGAGLEQDA